MFLIQILHSACGSVYGDIPCHSERNNVILTLPNVILSEAKNLINEIIVKFTFCNLN